MTSDKSCRGLCKSVGVGANGGSPDVAAHNMTVDGDVDDATT